MRPNTCQEQRQNPSLLITADHLGAGALTRPAEQARQFSSGTATKPGKLHSPARTGVRAYVFHLLEAAAA